MISTAALRTAVIAANAAGKQLVINPVAADGTTYQLNPTWDSWTPADASNPYYFQDLTKVTFHGSGPISGPISGTARMVDGGVMLFNATGVMRYTVVSEPPSFGRVASSNFPDFSGNPTNVLVPFIAIASVATGTGAVDATVGTVVGPNGVRLPDPNWVLGTGLS